MNTLLYSNRVNLPNSINIKQTPILLGYQNMMANIFVKHRPSPLQQVTPVKNENPVKMKWGEPTWFLLHTLSYKIKNDVFIQFKDEVLRIIYMICTNLPCPTCSEHAKQYLDGINFKTIQTKEQLKIMLFTFHNIVNQRKGYSQFLYDDCEAKYSNAITNNIIQNFMPYFADRSRSPKLMATDFQKTYIVKTLKEWFQKNIGIFDP
jgi:hypothetical protein